MSEPHARVALRRWTDFGLCRSLLSQCLADLGGVERFVRPGQTVVIKPNITANAPASSGGTTHVELVEAIVEQVNRRDPARTVVAEGTGRFGTELRTAFPTGGWREMADRAGVELYNLDGGPHIDVELDRPRYRHPLPFSKLVYDADVFISVPCLKTHLTADYTVALKNSYALTPQWSRSKIHREFLLEQALVDLNRIRKPDLVVVDGWDGAEGIAGGVAFDRPAGARVMLVGDDPVAVDVVSRQIMGLIARNRCLSWAIQHQLGEGDLEKIDILGDPLEDCIHPFMTASEEIEMMMPGLTLHDGDGCSGCRVAAVTGAWRFSHQKLLKPVDIVFGGLGSRPEAGENVLVIGECAARFADLGTHIEGCSPTADQVIDALEKMGAVCVQCRDLVQVAIEEHDDASLADVRIAAAGAEVFSGARVERGKWHRELLVGNCMARYAGIVSERASQFGLDPDEDVVWLRGCPVDIEDMRAALTQWREPVSSDSSPTVAG